MSYTDLTKDILSAFKAGFTNGADPFLPTEYPNQDFTKPQAQPWARVSVSFADRVNASIGTGHVRTLGVLFLQIFIPENGGTKKAREAGDKLASIFDNLDATMGGGSILFRRVNFSPRGKTQDGWHQSNATVEFQHDAIT